MFFLAGDFFFNHVQSGNEKRTMVSMRAAALGVGRCGGTGLAPRNPRNPPIQTRPLKRVIILFHGFSWACVTTFRNLSFFFGFADFRLLCMRVGNVHITFFLFLDKTRLHVQTFLPRRWIPSHCSDFCGSEPSAIRGVLHRRVYSAVLVNRAPVCRPFCYHATL